MLFKSFPAQICVRSLKIYDISVSNEPHLVGESTSAAPFHNVSVSGNFAFAVEGTYGLRVIDISIESNPIEVGNLQTIFPPYFDWGSIVIDGDLAYFVHNGDLMVIDVSEPTTPTVLGSTYSGGIDLEIVGNYAFVAGGNFEVFDISDPSNPVRKSSQWLDESWDLEIVGNIAVVAERNWGIRLFDISNPERPHELSELSIPGGAFRVATQGSVAILADDESRAALWTVDFSTPSEPKLTGYRPWSGRAYDVQVDRGTTYVNGYDFDSVENVDLLVFDTRECFPDSAFVVFADDFESGNYDFWSAKMP